MKMCAKRGKAVQLSLLSIEEGVKWVRIDPSPFCILFLYSQQSS